MTLTLSLDSLFYESCYTGKYNNLAKVMPFLPKPISEYYLLDDMPGASIPASRLNDILRRLHENQPLSALQQRFLEAQGLVALLALSRGAIDRSAFETAARSERQARLAAQAAARDQEEAATRFRQEITDRRNAEFFAAGERRRTRRALLDEFGLGYVKREDYPRVHRILRQVTDGVAIPAADLAWLGKHRCGYFTVKLRRAHHRILAEHDAKAWRDTGDPWNAVNACAHWRSADAAGEALTIADAALSRNTAVRLRAALLTTSGGALRDLGRLEEAITRGKEAHAVSPDDYRPCTLLGALHIETRAYAEGAVWFTRAEARGASRYDVDREIDEVLRAARPEDREEIKQAFRAHDPERFGMLWSATPRHADRLRLE